MQTRGNRVNVFFERGEVSMDLPRLDQSSDTIDITCGVLSAKLHRERFICPGINRDCIEYNGQLITPKTFYVMADKGSLKDWKNAIRINGKKLRRYIDTGELDFYNHAKLCTGRCKSRVSQTHKFALPESAVSAFNVAETSKVNDVPFEASDAAIMDSFGEERDIKPNLDQLQLLNMLQLQPGVNGEESSTEGEATPLQVVNVQSMSGSKDDDVMFWRAIVQLGLVDEFFREVKAKLDVLKGDMVKNCVPVEEAKRASRIVNELGMRDKLDMKLCAHKFEFDRQRNRLEREMEALKKKVSEYEQKTEVLKRKSDCYEQLMTKKLKLDEIPDNPEEKSITESGTTSPTPLFSNGDMSGSASPQGSTTPSQDQDNSNDSIPAVSLSLTPST